MPSTRTAGEKCGCTELSEMKAEAEKNYKRYIADMEDVPPSARKLWATLDYPKFWPPHLQERAKGVTARIGMCGEVMNAIAARWMIDHPKLK